MDIVSKKLAEVLDLDPLDADKEENAITTNPLTKQPVYSSSLVTESDILAFEHIQDTIGLETYSRIILMKTAQKALQDHDELIEIMAKVDDSKAARMAEVAVSALSASSDAAKSLMNFTLAREKMEIEKSKLEIKSVTINNNNNEFMMNGSQKDVLDQIKNMMAGEHSHLDDDAPPLIDV